MVKDSNTISFCPICGKAGKKILSPLLIKGTDKRMGKTRGELLDNIAADGFGSKDWRASYEGGI